MKSGVDYIPPFRAYSRNKKVPVTFFLSLFFVKKYLSLFCLGFWGVCLELFQKSKVIFEEQAHVIYAIS